jgi:hypothetical protein
MMKTATKLPNTTDTAANIQKQKASAVLNHVLTVVQDNDPEFLYWITYNYDIRCIADLLELFVQDMEGFHYYMKDGTRKLTTDSMIISVQTLKAFHHFHCIDINKQPMDDDKWIRMDDDDWMATTAEEYRNFATSNTQIWSSNYISPKPARKAPATAARLADRDSDNEKEDHDFVSALNNDENEPELDEVIDENNNDDSDPEADDNKDEQEVDVMIDDEPHEDVHPFADNDTPERHSQPLVKLNSFENPNVVSFNSLWDQIAAKLADEKRMKPPQQAAPTLDTKNNKQQQEIASPTDVLQLFDTNGSTYHDTSPLNWCRTALSFNDDYNNFGVENIDVSVGNTPITTTILEPICARDNKDLRCQKLVSLPPSHDSSIPVDLFKLRLGSEGDVDKDDHDDDVDCKNIDIRPLPWPDDCWKEDHNALPHDHASSYYVATAPLDHVKQFADALFPPDKHKCINVWTHHHQECEYTFEDNHSHDDDCCVESNTGPSSHCSNCVILSSEIEYLQHVIENLEADKKRHDKEIVGCHRVGNFIATHPPCMTLYDPSVGSDRDVFTKDSLFSTMSHTNSSLPLDQMLQYHRDNDNNDHKCHDHNDNNNAGNDPNVTTNDADHGPVNYDDVVEVAKRSINYNKDTTEKIRLCQVEENHDDSRAIIHFWGEERQDQSDCQRTHLDLLSKPTQRNDNNINASILKGPLFITIAWGAVIPLDPTTAAAAAAVVLRGEFYSKRLCAKTTHHPENANQVSATSLAMMCLNGLLNYPACTPRERIPQICATLEYSMKTWQQEPISLDDILSQSNLIMKTWQQEQISFDEILIQSSLMNRGQVQVQQHQDCLTTHNGETPAVFMPLAKALVTTGPRVGSKQVFKISLEWGDSKTTRPDFH